MLTVNQLSVVVCQMQESTGVVGIFTAAVDLQLNAKVAGIIPIKDGIWFVAVIVDTFYWQFGEAGRAEGCFFILVRATVASSGLTQDGPTAAASGIVFVVAFLTQGKGVCPGIVLPQNVFSALLAENGVLLQAVRTEFLASDQDHLVGRVFLTAQVADFGFGFHWYCLLDISFDPPVAPVSIKGTIYRQNSMV